MTAAPSDRIFLDGRRVSAGELGDADRELARRLARELDYWEGRIIREPASDWSGPEGVLLGAPASELSRPALVNCELVVAAEGEAGVIDVCRPAPLVSSGEAMLVRPYRRGGSQLLTVQAVASIPATSEEDAEHPWRVRLEAGAQILGLQDEVLAEYAVEIGDAEWLERAPSRGELERDLEEAVAELESEGYWRL